jgi:SPP1 family predicted phage head-tail adaptor
MSFGYSLSRPSATNLRYTVDLLALNENDDDSYGDPPYETVAAGVYADVQDLRGFELIRASKIAAKATHYVTIRYRDGLQAGMRLLFEGTRTFYIWAVLDEFTPRRVWLALYCEELQAQ